MECDEHNKTLSRCHASVRGLGRGRRGGAGRAAGSASYLALLRGLRRVDATAVLTASTTAWPSAVQPGLRKGVMALARDSPRRSATQCDAVPTPPCDKVPPDPRNPVTHGEQHQAAHASQSGDRTRTRSSREGIIGLPGSKTRRRTASQASRPCMHRESNAHPANALRVAASACLGAMMMIRGKAGQGKAGQGQIKGGAAEPSDARRGQKGVESEKDERWPAHAVGTFSE